MADLSRLPEWGREYLLGLRMDQLPQRPWRVGPTLSRCRVAMLSTAGLHLQDDVPFREGSADFRVIPSSAAAKDLTMSHISVNFDRIGLTEDINVAFPLERVREMAADGDVRSVADKHYSFMGATAPRKLRPAIQEAGRLLKADDVDLVLLVPV